MRVDCLSNERLHPECIIKCDEWSGKQRNFICFQELFLDSIVWGNKRHVCIYYMNNVYCMTAYVQPTKKINLERKLQTFGMFRIRQPFLRVFSVMSLEFYNTQKFRYFSRLGNTGLKDLLESARLSNINRRPRTAETKCFIVFNKAIAKQTILLINKNFSFRATFMVHLSHYVLCTFRLMGRGCIFFSPFDLGTATLLQWPEHSDG